MLAKLKNIVSILILLFIGIFFIASLSERGRIFSISYVVIISIFELFPFKKYKPNDIFYPKYLLLVLYYLYSLSGILVIELKGADSQGTAIPLDIVDKFIFSCLLGLTGLCFGFLAFAKSNFNDLKLPLKKINEEKIYTILKVFVFFALVINFSEILKKYNIFSIESYADRALSYRLERRESTGSGLYEVFLVDSPVLIINFFCFYYFLKFKNLKIKKYFFLIPYIFCLLTAILSGFRSSLVNAVLPMLFLYHYQYSRFKLSIPRVLFYLLLGGLAYFIINLLAFLRSTSDPLEMIKMIMDLISNQGFSFLSIENSGELETSTNFMRLMLGIQRGEVDFSYGKTILDEILVYIPLAFYPDRPHPVSEQFVMTFYPQIHNMGGGMGQYCLLEGYWAFGNIGVFLTSFLFSKYLVKFYRYIAPYLVLSPIYVLLYSQVFDKAVLSVVRGGYIGAIKASLISTVVIILAIIFSKIKK
ncbi:oligosaccharide repeat unit polymerase [Flavobacterium rhamnosiphilum]|uniref:Oligosaccharide repeat unit polymerase n=1 Tax=Flavobacterium rhamnosiphilum TaxID=2541724 RepID=A0A4R5F3G0_9FLAO|nr:O-antigen polymerase [Flavobacterium rhamnosiphilum]TDE41744.1 oligosaccharide repeat unit polymerase [Flavobacterium rhamnosiphilum]